ncbi:hypothetical protein [uncultured Lacinutrix sp.]|uniref:hypothetical protein n=1 Tax=uncultured Lacinutrix sp. TaxID=574032 RepID=UPI002616B079|nr:hypothetical protein [uncultured Lacinutrix sp.]
MKKDNRILNSLKLNTLTSIEKNNIRGGFADTGGEDSAELDNCRCEDEDENGCSCGGNDR